MSYRYVKQSDNTVWHINELRSLYKNVSIPEGGDMSMFGYELLIETPRPSDQAGFMVVEDVPVNNVQTWKLEVYNDTPTTVSMRQARLALLQFGLLSTVNGAVNGGNEADKITWEYATEVHRSDALVTNMASALNLTEEQLDSLFTLASTL